MNENIVRKTTNCALYFDNGFSESSDEDPEAISDLTCINEIRPHCASKSASCQTFYSNGIEYEDDDSYDEDEPVKRLTHFNKFPVINNKEQTRGRYNDDNDQKTWYKEASVNTPVNGSIFYNNDTDSSTDDDEDPMTELTVINNIHPFTPPTINGRVLNIKSPFSENNSKTSSISSGSYFDNGFPDSSDDERNVSLSVKNNLQNRLTSPPNTKQEEINDNQKQEEINGNQTAWNQQTETKLAPSDGNPTLGDEQHDKYPEAGTKNQTVASFPNDYPDEYDQHRKSNTSDKGPFDHEEIRVNESSSPDDKLRYKVDSCDAGPNINDWGNKQEVTPHNINSNLINNSETNKELVVPSKHESTDCSTLEPPFPFRKKFDQTGLRIEGQNIFEFRLKENNFKTSGDVNRQETEAKDEDSDLEIDGGNFPKQNLTKTRYPFSENKRKIRPEESVGRQKSHVSFSNWQTSVGAYGHTCSGCGRKDCDGKFMKLLREMIRTGHSKGFEIRNVVPDGNCMFAATVDQLELLSDCFTSPFALRQLCVQYLKSHPTSQDGTPFYMFVDGESWEDYLSRMGQEGQWGDHLMLQAISSVTNRTIKIIKDEDEKNWTSIKPMYTDSTKPEPIYLGHVGELHYVSMRPVTESGDEPGVYESMMSLDLYSLMPSLPNIGDSDQQQMFKEDYIDPWSDIPAVHLTFLIKQFIPLKSTIKNADSMCHQAFAIESSTDDFMGQSSRDECAFQFKAIGDVVEGLFASSLDDRGLPEARCSGEWADVGIICSLTSCIAYPQSMKDTVTIDQSDVIVDTKNTHPGYARLLARYPDKWSLNAKAKDAVTYYIPNTHKKFEDADATKQFKDQYANQNPAIVYLFRKTFSGIYSPFWPDEASSWRNRKREAGWPAPELVDSIVSEGVYYISHPHVKSTNPGIEFEVCTGVAGRRLANEGLSKEQRYCFIVFKALISHSLMGNEYINSNHLKSVFFHVCEQIPQQYWTSRVSGCILFLIDSLIRQLEMKILPNYFISTNNMIDHLSSDQIQGVLDKLKDLRINPVSSLYSVAYQNMVTNADEIFQEIRYDIDDFHEHKSVRQSVIGTLVPAKIKQAAKYIEVNNMDMAIEIIQEAHEDRLLVSTCEDNIPFVAFVTEVTNSFGLSKQWWLCLHSDETLGTSLTTDLSLQHNPIPLKEIVGHDTADRYEELLIPRPLAENLFTFCFDFYRYLSLKHRKKKAVAFLVKGREFFMQLQQFGTLSHEFPCTINMDDFQITNVFKIYSSLVQNFIMSSESLCNFRLDEIAPEVQAICERMNSEEAYSILVLMWKFLGNTEKFNEASAKLDYVAANARSHHQ